jgi:phosphoglycolate phosphatase-like HAD superfamily hydrolase
MMEQLGCHKMFAALFDLEGTLVRSPADRKDIIREFRISTKKKLVELGIPSCELKGLGKSTAVLRNKAFEYVESNFGLKEAQHFHFEIDKFLKTYELNWAKRSMPFPETLLVLGQLTDLELKMAIVTNTSREAAEQMLSMHQLSEFFDVVITREDVKKLKPEPEGISLALRKLNAKDFFFVGDQELDSLATKKAGGISIILNRSSSGKKSHADYVVQSLWEIPNFVSSYDNTKTKKRSLFMRGF